MNHPCELSGTSPPIPPSDTSKPSTSTVGQNFLALIRSVENQPTDIDALEKAVDAFQKLVEVTHRRGLLQGDQAVAEKVLAMSSAGSMAKGGKKRKGKRGRGKNNDLTMQSEGPEDTQNSASGPAPDGQLILSAVQRVLSNTNEKLEDGILLTALAANLLTAIGTSIMSRPATDTCTIAEYELMATAGKQLLAGLEVSARSIMEMLPNISSQYPKHSGVSTGLEECEHALKACLRACAVLVALFGNKLSRSTALLTSLRTLSWDCFSVQVLGGNDMLELATKLLAALPLAGEIGNKDSSDLWNECLEEALVSLSFVLNHVAPLGVSSYQNEELPAFKTESARSRAENWIERIRQTNSEKLRCELFLQLVGGLVQLVTSLIARDDLFFGMDASVSPLTSAVIDCDAILDLVDTMISFPMASEANFHGTKKRLRSEAIEGGLISPNMLVAKIANFVKLCGHKLLDGAILSNVGAAALFPWTRRILRMTHAALLTSSSAALRRLVDPSNDMQFSGGKRQRWLHSAVSVRKAAVMTFQRAVQAFGCDPQNMSNSHSGSASKCSGDVEKSLHLICGYLLEESTVRKMPQPLEWGSLYERAQLAASSANCLAASLSSGGEFLSLPIRDLVDSTARVCLWSIKDNQTMTTFCQVRAAYLHFAGTCVGTPWPDGAASSILNDLLEAAKLCKEDGTAVVNQASWSAIRVCDAQTFPRVPALSVISRTLSISAINSSPAEVMKKDLSTIQSEIDTRRVEQLRQQQQEEAVALAKQAEADHARESKRKRMSSVAGQVNSRSSVEVPPSLADVSPALSSSEHGGDASKTEEPKKKDETNTSDDVVPEPPVGIEKAAAKTSETADDEESDDDFPIIVDGGGPDDDDI